MTVYTVYRREKDGRRKEIIERFNQFAATMRHNEAGSWSLSGTEISGFSPFQTGDGVIVYRDDEVFLSGFIKTITEDIDETFEDGHLTRWTVDGYDDNGLLSLRSIFPDPASLDITAASHQTITDAAGNAILTFIRTQAGTDAASGRVIPRLFTEAPQNEGSIGTFQARFQPLLEFVQGIAHGAGLSFRLRYDEASEGIIADVYRAVDHSERVIFAREFGNLRSWVHKRTAPKANAVWVVGQGEMTARMVSYREDSASIERWGRIEVIKDRRDISDQAVADDPRTPQERLDEAAKAFLSESVAGDSYELELAPIERLQFRRDWDLGDIVTIRIGNEAIQAAISEGKIDYAAGIETVKPSVGTISRGTLGKTYGEIRDIRQRLEVLERI